MKKNKLALASGILLVIVASFCIAYSVSYIGDLITFLTTPFEVLDESYFVSYYLILAIYIVFIALNVLQAIAYMIMGVKLIRKTNKRVPYAKMKPLIIIAIVFSAIGILFNFLSINNSMLIACVVLLSCALGKGDKYEKEPIGATNSNINFNITDEKEIDLFVEKAKMLKELKDNNVISQQEFETMISKAFELEKTNNKKESEVEDENKKNSL